MSAYSSVDLIQYFYSETSKAKTLAIQKALQEDVMLIGRFEDLKYSLHALDLLLEEPRAQSIVSILDYAARTAVAIQ